MSELDPNQTYRLERPVQETLLRKGIAQARANMQKGRMGTRDITQGLKKDELLRLLLAGRKTSECARILGISMNTCRHYMSQHEVQEALRAADMSIWEQVDEELRLSKLSTIQQLTEMSQTALARMRELMESEDEAIALRAASDTLDRVPDTSKKSVGMNTNLSIKIDPNQLALAALAAQELEQAQLGCNQHGQVKSESPTSVLLEGKKVPE